MKTKLFMLFLLVSALPPSCGPSKSELRTELQSIDHELLILRNAAYQHRSQMSQAEFAALIGSFTTGYGMTSGEVDVAGDGITTVVNAEADYNAANYSLEQIKSRQIELLKRRAVIAAKLR